LRWGKESVVLKDHAEAAALRREVGDVLVLKEDRTGVGLFQAGDHPQRRCLATA
jgi:hypothetical protein